MPNRIKKQDEDFINLYETLTGYNFNDITESALAIEQDIISKVISLATTVGKTMIDMEGVFTFLSPNFNIHTDILSRSKLNNIHIGKEVIKDWPRLPTLAEDSEIDLDKFLEKLNVLPDYNALALLCNESGFDTYDTVEIIMQALFGEYSFIIYNGKYSSDIFSGLCIYLITNVKIITNLKFLYNENT